MSTLYAGLDVSLEMTSVCVVDADGHLLAEKQVSSDPEAIAKVLLLVEGARERVGLEAGPLSQWLFFGLKDAGLPAVCIETRHAKAAITAMSRNKNDRNDARSIAQIVRSGWFKAVHVKSTDSQELRTLLTSREFLVNKAATTRTRCAARSGHSGSRSAESARADLPSAFVTSSLTGRAWRSAWRRC